jgi:gliding motility-associated-like protein
LPHPSGKPIRYFIALTTGRSGLRPVTAALTSSLQMDIPQEYRQTENSCCFSKDPTQASLPITSIVQHCPVGRYVEFVINSLVSDPDNNADLSTLSILIPLRSGAKATIASDYSIKLELQWPLFSGMDTFTIQLCDALASCVQKEFSVEAIGEISIFDEISDNGDGKNDIFYIQYIDALSSAKNNKVTIFNRWGDIVFEADNYVNVNRVFRGQNKSGNELPPGAYYYKIDFPEDSKSVNGFISLKR